METPSKRWSVRRGQRQRWIKGHRHTWRVHLRAPMRTLQEMGAGHLIVLQPLMLGGAASALLHGPLLLSMALLMAAAAISGDGLTPGPEGRVLVGGSISTAMGSAVAAWRQRRPDCSRRGLTASAHGALGVLAAPAVLERMRRAH